ncbi:hypothetical protein KR018_007877 [Drosophila ironensis]|nr:hypothetical protein KR018_007877 [Drosophila ironensis]
MREPPIFPRSDRSAYQNFLRLLSKRYKFKKTVDQVTFGAVMWSKLQPRYRKFFARSNIALSADMETELSREIERMEEAESSSTPMETDDIENTSSSEESSETPAQPSSPKSKKEKGTWSLLNYFR